MHNKTENWTINWVINLTKCDKLKQWTLFFICAPHLVRFLTFIWGLFVDDWRDWGSWWGATQPFSICWGGYCRYIVAGVLYWACWLQFGYGLLLELFSAINSFNVEVQIARSIKTYHKYEKPVKMPPNIPKIVIMVQFVSQKFI